MPKNFRVIDTGIRSGREQMAFDQAMIDAHREGEIPDTIRFLRFPPTASLGRHQSLSQEIKQDYCRENNIGIMRRMTGGGSLYLDEGQPCWELVFSRSTLGISSLADLAKEICGAAAHGLSKLGIDAQFRPRNDIEVDGRKISGSGGFFDGDTLFYQGTLLADMDPQKMLAALNVPKEKLEKRALDSAADRVTTLKALLGDLPDFDEINKLMLEGFAEKLGIEPVWGEITQGEEDRAKALFDEEIGTDEFIADIDNPGGGEGVMSGKHTGAGGTVTAHVRLEGAGQNRFREVLITGDFFVTPPRIIFDLESSLRGTFIENVRETVNGFFEKAEIGMLSVTADDFASAVENAIANRA